MTSVLDGGMFVSPSLLGAGGRMAALCGLSRH